MNRNTRIRILNERGCTIAFILGFLLIMLSAAYVEYCGSCDWWDGEPVSGKPERCLK